VTTDEALKSAALRLKEQACNSHVRKGVVKGATI
jgi:hypothetical protein